MPADARNHREAHILRQALSERLMADEITLNHWYAQKDNFTGHEP